MSYPRIKLVKSFEELVGTRFGDGVNALCWIREVPGDFREVVEQLAAGGLGGGERGDGIMPLTAKVLENLTVSEAGRVAIDFMLQDFRRLEERGLSPGLDCISAYPRDDGDTGVVRTDVYSFHADSAPEEADTWLCTYHGPASEGVANEDAVRRVDVPETRAQLLEEFGGREDADFVEYLSDNCYDLHYAAAPGAQIFQFGLGNLWRIAVQYPGSPVPPCIHRAPETRPGDPPRLLLIS